MMNIEKLKEDKKKTLAKLDAAMDAHGPERQTMSESVDKVRNKFLDVWEQYNNQKASEQEFLEISKNLAKILESEKKMLVRIRKIIQPLHKKFENACDALDDLEKKS